MTSISNILRPRKYLTLRNLPRFNLESAPVKPAIFSNNVKVTPYAPGIGLITIRAVILLMTNLLTGLKIIQFVKLMVLG